MKDSTIINIGKLTFAITFLLGNICFWGFFLTNIIGFAIFGSYFIFLGTMINITIFLVLLIYGSFNNAQFKICLKSSFIILLNLPILLLYGFLISN
ncbi:hypothetical protein AB670_00768 [Chryseobacterium sp. MOF25P]|jgi:LIVCS family branched-chain amino acid:cation transporter|uniref:hypothetical protein n=1 Tax=unclassified Chryseobacterium TaxID=2593645 RepID=UPI0008057458|nr:MULTISPECIES: hypothetical protein [unclassified Chryseobacterium]OBW42818.1 hypothetical protein AB670_00768 [Chryseobacterium sp. MOF25P]OBW46580.1 hypothetical protein AB671_01264 [Chryseobacterium sp. BGARF1]